MNALPRLYTLPACLALLPATGVTQSPVAQAAPAQSARSQSAVSQPVPVPSAALSVGAPKSVSAVEGGRTDLPSTSSVSVAAGVPLRLLVTKTTSLHPGSPVDAVLEQPVYVRDRIAISAGTTMHGIVSSTEPAARLVRVRAWLDGDITPQRIPVVRFETMDGNNGPMAIAAEGRMRSTQWVRFTSSGKKKKGMLTMGREMVNQQMESTRSVIFDPGKGDRALRLLYSQLPYHPQRIWKGTQIIADLQSSPSVPVPELPGASLVPAASPDLNGLHVVARLTDDVNSDRAKKDDPVIATVTEPVYDAKGGLVLPEGSIMRGRVLQSRPSRSFGRNGQLRFTIADVQRKGEAMQRAHGVLTGATGATDENLSVDQEGGVKAQPDKGRFLAPLLLGALAVAGRDGDRENGGGGNVGGQLVASNGFGIVARIISLTVQDKNVSTGFGMFAFAKSVTFRFLTPGHPVNFQKDTMVEVELQSR